MTHVKDCVKIIIKLYFMKTGNCKYLIIVLN